MQDNIYFFDITDNNLLSSEKCRFNAAQKPRTDTLKTIKDIGIKEIILYSQSIFNVKSKIKRRLLIEYNNIYLLHQYNSLCSKIKDSIIIVQYPFINSGRFNFLKRIKKQNNKIILFIHDIESVRHNKCIQDEIDLLNLSDVCILHSTAMINNLYKLGLKTRAIPLGLFDYRSNLVVKNDTDLKNIRMIFAGNLDKSDFIKKLDKLNLCKSFQINMYGKESKNIRTSSFIHYKGKFEADKFDMIQGNWGLVWDGHDIDSCTGNLGEYLKFNAPFKASLYLAANKPIITWSRSAIAEYVNKYDLGICVDSLGDIKYIIEKMQDSKLNAIRTAVEEMSIKVRNGMMLRNALNKALSLI